MTRRRRLGWAATACSAWLLAFALSGPAALAANGKSPKGLVLTSFKLKGSHHYELEAISVREGSAATIAAVVATRQDSRPATKRRASPVRAYTPTSAPWAASTSTSTATSARS